jgi:hypothetical protein
MGYFTWPRLVSGSLPSDPRFADLFRHMNLQP